MTKSVLRLVLHSVNVGGDSSEQVTNTNLHSHGNGSLVRARDVVGDPGDNTGDGGVDTEGGKVTADVGGSRVGSSRNGDGENVTEHHANQVECNEDRSLLQLIGEPGLAHTPDSSNNVNGDGEELGLGGGVAEVLDNGGQEEGDGVKRTDDTPEESEMQPGLDILEGVPEVLGVHGIILGNGGGRGLTIKLDSVHDELSLFLGQELGGLGVIVEGEVSNEANDDGGDTLKDENPSPALKASNTSHLGDSESKQTREGTSNRGGREEHSLSELKLSSAVPGGEIVSDTREKTSLEDTEQDSCGEKTSIVLNNTHKSHDQAPENHDGREPDRGSELLKQHVRGDFEGGVGEEEDGEGHVVLLSSKLKISRKALDVSVTNVTSIEETQQVEKRQHGNDVEIHLSQQLAQVYAGVKLLSGRHQSARGLLGVGDGDLSAILEILLNGGGFNVSSVGLLHASR